MDTLHFKKEDIVTSPVDMDGAEFHNADVLGIDNDCPLDAGISEYYVGNEVVFEHDNYGDVVYIIEGELIFEENTSDIIVHGKAGDMIWMPKKSGLKMKLHSPNYAKIFWSSFPHWQ